MRLKLGSTTPLEVCEGASVGSSFNCFTDSPDGLTVGSSVLGGNEGLAVWGEDGDTVGTLVGLAVGAVGPADG